jgi:uncharacterized protein
MTDTISGRADPRATRTAIAALVVGGVLLGITLNVENGTWQFYAAGFVLAATWVTAYTIAPTRARLDRRRTMDAAVGVLVGAAMFGVFVVASSVLHRIHLFDSAVDDLLKTADSSAVGWVILLAGVNAVAEELFFRGTLIDAVPRRFAYAAGIAPYVFTSAPSGNIALVLAAAVMGTVFTVLRMRTGALTASIATHLAWSALMILVFPR